MKAIAYLAVLVLICITSVDTAQAADTDKDKAAATNQARAHFKKGTQAYRLANFQEALGHFTEAMKLSPRPSVILNMAQCHRQLDHHKKALFFYKLYLTEWARVNPEGDKQLQFQAEVNKYIGQLEEKLQDKGPAPTPVEPKPVPVEPEPRPETKLVPAVVLQPSPAPKDQGTSIKKVAGWTLITTGAALTVSGIVLGVLASQKSGELEDLAKTPGGGGPFSEHDDLEAEGQALNNGMIATLSLGAGAAVGGAVLILLHYTDLIEARSAWLAPSVVPGGAFVSGGVRF